MSLCLSLLIDLLLGLLLSRQLLCLLFSGQLLHSALREGLVAHEAAVHALHGHLARPTGLLDTVAVVLVDLVVTRVVLRFGHDEG